MKKSYVKKYRGRTNRSEGRVDVLAVRVWKLNDLPDIWFTRSQLVDVEEEIHLPVTQLPSPVTSRFAGTRCLTAGSRTATYASLRKSACDPANSRCLRCNLEGLTSVLVAIPSCLKFVPQCLVLTGCVRKCSRKGCGPSSKRCARPFCSPSKGWQKMTAHVAG